MLYKLLQIMLQIVAGLVVKLQKSLYEVVVNYGGGTAHGLDLALESIASVDCVSRTVQDGKSIVKFTTGHHMSQALFTVFSKND